MTEAMIDKVARAMFEHEWKGQRPPENEWQQSKAYWKGFAKVALEALRDPTAEMVEAGFEHTGDPCWPEDVAKAFRAMIDKALA